MKTDGHNIPFESFLGTEGAEKIPDIDLNFSGTYQPIAHKFIHDMFGKQKSFKAGTILTVADKTAYGYIKNYFEETSPELQPRDAEIAYLARKCIDVKRTNGQHAGGMVVVPEDCDLTDFTPYNYPPDGDTFG
jgi:DNA polymerase-3 subunit alpha (Gram-positive type)